MGRELYESSPQTQELFKKASEILGRDIAKICLEGPEDVLMKTENAQPAIFLVSIALWHQLKEKCVAQNNEITYVAGHSLGEITAYYAAEVLDLKTALTVINHRGKAMAQAYPSQDSAMSAVIGTPITVIEEVLKEVSQKHLVVIANYNSPEQTVISGTKEGVAVASKQLEEKGAKRVIPLSVSGPFHSPLMNSASESLKAFLKEIPFSDAKIPIILNRSAKEETNSQLLKENLSVQVKSSVHWTDTILYMKPKIEAITECGPGKVLTGLIRKIDRGIPLI